MACKKGHIFYRQSLPFCSLIFYNSLFAFVFGGCCVKLKNIWIAFGFDRAWEGWDKSVWLVARPCGNPCNPSSLSKRRNSFFYEHLDFIIRQLLINFITFFEKVRELIWNHLWQTFQTNQSNSYQSWIQWASLWNSAVRSFSYKSHLKLWIAIGYIHKLIKFQNHCVSRAVWPAIYQETHTNGFSGDTPKICSNYS